MQTLAQKDEFHVKKGWLLKCAKDSGKNWRKRYFILTHNTLNYYLDDKDLRKPKGNVLIVGDGQVRNENAISTKKGKENNKKFFGFRFTSPFESILFLSATERERALWVKSIQYAIDHAHLSLRGYMLKKTSAMNMLESTSRKFWVLHKNHLTYHKDHENTKIDEFSYEITDDVEIEPDDHKWKLKLNDGKGNRIVTIQFEERTKDQYPLWRDALLDIRHRHEREEEVYQQHVKQVMEEAVVASKSVAVLGRDGHYHESAVAVSQNEVIVQEKAEDGTTHATFFALSPSSTITLVSEEDGGNPLTFQITTASETIQLTASSEEEVHQWQEAIAKVNPHPIIADADAILTRAAIAMMNDNVYETTIVEKKALGIVFQPIEDWAIVKHYQGYDSSITGVTPGSVLVAVNGQGCTLNRFNETTSALSEGFQAAEPLVLTFRRAPSKEGYLNKKSASKKNGQSKWTNRRFVLDAGKLSIFPIAGEGDQPIHVPLKGASVHLVKFSEYLKPNAFRVNVGPVSIVLQTETMEECLEWAATLKCAAAIASGGGFILDEELNQITKSDNLNNTLVTLPEDLSEEAQSHVMTVGQAIQDQDSQALEIALTAAYGVADVVEHCGGFLELAGNLLNEMFENDHFRATDMQALTAITQPDEEQARIIEEQAFMSEAMTLMEGQDGDSDDEGQGPSRKTMARASVSNSLGADYASVDVESEEQAAEDSMVEFKHLKELEKLAEPDPEEVGVCANEEDLQNIFRFYKRRNQEGGADFINVMNFCTIWRMVTGDKGNLMREMQVFNSFDQDKNGYLEENDFVTGFLNHAVEKKTNKLLIKLHSLVAGGSVML